MWQDGHQVTTVPRPSFSAASLKRADGTARHVARPVRLMIVGGAAAIGRPAGRVHIVADALQQHDRQPDHLGMAKHVAAEPERDAIVAYSHLRKLLVAELQSREDLDAREIDVGSCLAGSWRVSLRARCLAIRTSSIASSPADLSAGTQRRTGRSWCRRPTQATVSSGAASPLASRRKPSVPTAVSAAQADVIDHRTGVETGAARRAQAPRVPGPALARNASVVSARAGLQLGHLGNVRRTSHMVKPASLRWWSVCFDVACKALRRHAETIAGIVSRGPLVRAPPGSPAPPICECSIASVRRTRSEASRACSGNRR